MKTKVAVEVNLMRVVYVEVEDPKALTEDEREEAIDAAEWPGAEDMGGEIVGVRLP